MPLRLEAGLSCAIGDPPAFAGLSQTHTNRQKHFYYNNESGARGIKQCVVGFQLFGGVFLFGAGILASVSGFCFLGVTSGWF